MSHILSCDTVRKTNVKNISVLQRGLNSLTGVSLCQGHSLIFVAQKFFLSFTNKGVIIALPPYSSLRKPAVNPFLNTGQNYLYAYMILCKYTYQYHIRRGYANIRVNTSVHQSRVQKTCPKNKLTKKDSSWTLMWIALHSLFCHSSSWEISKPDPVVETPMSRSSFSQRIPKCRPRDCWSDHA